MLRRFRNDTDTGFHFTSHGVLIGPGEQGEVDMPEEQPVPDGLVEIHRRRERHVKPTTLVSIADIKNARGRRGARRRITEPKSVHSVVAEPATHIDIEEG